MDPVWILHGYRMDRDNLSIVNFLFRLLFHSQISTVVLVDS